MPKIIHTAFSYGAVERLRHECAQRDLSAWKLARATGISIAQAQNILAGTLRQPSLETIARCAKTLNLSMDYLVFGQKK